MKKFYSPFPRKIALAGQTAGGCLSRLARPAAAAILFVALNFATQAQQTKYPSVQSQNTMTATQTMEISGNFKVNQETRLLQDAYLEKLKDLALPATQDRLVLIDKFGKMKGGPPFESIPPGNGGGNGGGGNPNPQACTGFHWSEVSGTPDIFNCQLGNVGIGSSGANQKLTIKGGGIGFDYNSADKKLYSPADGDLEWMTNNFAGVHGFAVSHQGDKKVYLNTNGDSYFMGGNVGIGNINPTEKFEVNGNIRIDDDYDLLLRNSHHGLGWYGPATYSGIAKKFADTEVDGPVLYGNSGGALGVYNDNGKKIALLWTAPGSTSNLANIQQNISNNRIALASTYASDTYLPGLVWYTTDNNSTKPKAGIWVKVDQLGSRMYLGTSNSYPSGITNAAIAIESDGRVSIGGPGSAYKLDVGGDFRVISAGNAFVDINSTNQNSLLRLMAVSSSGRQEAQIQYRGILQFVEPLPGETGSTVRLTIDGAGTVHCKRVNVATSWSDFALKEDFKRMSMDEKEKFWKKHKHLPSVPSGKEIEKDGLDVGGVMKGMMQEVEETRLDVTELYKIILDQKKEIELLKKEMEEMKGEK